jgi:hypothetical protein
MFSRQRCAHPKSARQQVRIVTITGLLSLPLLSLPIFCVTVMAQEVNPEEFTSASQLSVLEPLPGAIATTDDYLFAQVESPASGFQLPNVFIPPQPIGQVNAANLGTTTTKRGDRPELREIMRLAPAPFPSFVYE